MGRPLPGIGPGALMRRRNHTFPSPGGEMDSPYSEDGYSFNNEDLDFNNRHSPHPMHHPSSRQALIRSASSGGSGSPHPGSHHHAHGPGHSQHRQIQMSIPHGSHRPKQLSPNDTAYSPHAVYLFPMNTIMVHVMEFPQRRRYAAVVGEGVTWGEVCAQLLGIGRDAGYGMDGIEGMMGFGGGGGMNGGMNGMMGNVGNVRVVRGGEEGGSPEVDVRMRMGEVLREMGEGDGTVRVSVERRAPMMGGYPGMMIPGGYGSGSGGGGYGRRRSGMGGMGGMGMHPGMQF